MIRLGEGPRYEVDIDTDVPGHGDVRVRLEGHASYGVVDLRLDRATLAETGEPVQVTDELDELFVLAVTEEVASWH